MLISEVLRLHNAPAQGAFHPDILGDSFLMRENCIYRNVKNMAVTIGCQYTEAWPQYLALPFHELNNIVATKKIPYIPSARMLQEIEAKRANTFTTDNLQMPESFHMHEAAHVIAEHVFRDMPLKTPQEKIFKTILCESFANTVDALACTEAKDELHQYFLMQNCYMNPDKEDLDAMIRLIAKIGFIATFKLIVIGYTHSNFLHAALSRATTEQWIGKAPADTEIISAMCEKLDPQFRVQTTEMYLRLEGYDGEVFDILDFPFMQILAERKDFVTAIESLGQVLEK